MSTRLQAITCAACRADTKRQPVTHDELITCARIRSRSKQWWEREPGYFWREFKPQGPTQWWPAVGSLLAPNSRYAGRVRPDFRTGFALPAATHTQLLAELRRQSERLK